MQKIISRRDAVRRIALRFGYTGPQAEDIAQEAALRLVENPRLVSQSNKQAFIDALRSGGEAEYSRAGVTRLPIFESAFEDYPNFIAGVRSEYDLERVSIVKGDLLDTVSALEVLRPKLREILEAYAEGRTMVEISKRYGCTESRICQLIDLSRVRLKEAIISARLSRQKQRKRKWAESHPLPFEVQKRSRMEILISFAMEAVRFKAIEGLVSFKVPKVPQSFFTSF